MGSRSGDRKSDDRCALRDAGPKVSFKQLLARNRCLIAVDGFFEQQSIGRVRIRCASENEGPEAVHDGGLWDLWRDPDGDELYSFTIITTPANKLLRPLHDRMPLV
jgi:putative SOS response-associated peptidase YedK